MMGILEIIIFIILIIVNGVVMIFIYKNDNNEIDYDKWCNLYKEETSELVKEIKNNDVKIKKLNKVIRKNKYKH